MWHKLLAIVPEFIAHPVWTWIHRLGGPGLILLGIVDSSVIPIPGSMDLFVVVLSAHRRGWWPYYGLMATAGAVLGGYITYRLAEIGGEETLEKKIGKRRADKVYEKFKKHGFATVLIGAILPPPFPIVPFLMSAGVLHYPRKNFLTALAVGRAIRFFAVAYLSHLYGHAVIQWGENYYKPLLYTVIGLAVLSVIAGLAFLKWRRPQQQHES